MKNKKSTTIILSVAQIYDDILWFEQLLDFISELPSAKVWLPRIVGTKEVELNLFFPLIVEQFDTAFVDVLVDDLDVYTDELIEVHQFASGKINNYIRKDAKKIDVKMLNEDVQILLANQYENLLDERMSVAFKELKRRLAQKINQLINKHILEDTGKNKETHVVIVPIEYMYTMTHAIDEDAFYTYATYVSKNELILDGTEENLEEN